MERICVDVAVIGQGRSALEAYREAVAQGARTLWLDTGEGRHETCMHELERHLGAALIAAAQRLALLREAEGLGVDSARVRLDQDQLLLHLRELRNQFLAHQSRALVGIPREDRRRGSVRFIDRHTLVFNEACLVQAEAFVLMPDWVRKSSQCLSHLVGQVLGLVDLCQQKRLPASAMLTGSGVTAAQLGWALACLGIDTTLVDDGDWLQPLSDPELRTLAEHWWGDSVRVVPEAELTAKVREGHVAGPGLALATAGEQAAEAILVVQSWVPRFDSYQLTAAGVNLDSRGLPIYDPSNHRCTGSNLYLAITDVPSGCKPASPGMARWVARHAVRSGAAPEPWPRVSLSVYPGWPPVALVGKRYADLELGHFVTGEALLGGIGGETIEGLAQGKLKLYAGYPDGQLLGAEILGEGAEFLGHLLAWALQQFSHLGPYPDELLAMPMGEESLGQPLREALENCREQLLRWRAQYPPEGGVLV